MRIKKRTVRKFDADLDELNYKFSYNDDETKALHARLNRASSITIDDLRRVALWKSDRVLSVSHKTLQKLEALSRKRNLKISDKIVKDVLDGLVASQGIGFPMASAILKFIEPDVFPIVDVRAYRALSGKKPYYGTYTYQKYVKYAKDLANLAAKTGRPLREIDEQLYCFDEKHNGKI